MTIRTTIFFLITALLALGQSRASSAGQVLHQRLRNTSQDPALRLKPVFVPLPAGVVSPRGWLRDWASDARNGITGHLDEYSEVYGEAWKGHPFEARGAAEDGTGWPLEQSSYWLDGAVRLAWLLNDDALKEKVRQRLDPIVAGVLQGGESFIFWRPKSALENGFNNWAHSQMGRALLAYYQASGDPRILAALVKVYRDFPLPVLRSTFYDVSGAVNLDAMLETYVLSGEKALLERALEFARSAAFREVASEWRQGHFAPGHAVIFFENILVPSLLYPWTAAPDNLESTIEAIAWQDRHHVLPYGVSSGEEYLAGIGATRNTETCGVAASLWTYLALLRTTGQGAYSDRIEKILFNAGPAPVARDFKTMCYYQSPNRYGAANPREEPRAPGPGSYSFTPIGHQVLCCVGSLNRIVPHYAMHLWMATLDGGLAATLYGPSMVQTTMAEGVEVNIEEVTAYPFDESIHLEVRPAVAVDFPLYLRIPAWCRSPRLEMNGAAVPLTDARNGFVVLKRKWQPGDKVALRLPMEAIVVQGRETPFPKIEYFAKRALAGSTPGSPWASVCYGPLLFALPIPDASPNREAAGARYQYALDVAPGHEARRIHVVRRAMPSRWNWPLDSPLQLSARMRAFDWRPGDGTPLPDRPIRGGKPAHVRLVPYGCTKFRVSMFPVTSDSLKSKKIE